MDKELHRIAITGIIHKPRINPLDVTGQGWEYLITKRSPEKKAFPGKWTVPGGGLETDDYINTPPTTPSGQWYFAVEKTLRREIKEEVNLEVEKPKYLLDLAFVRPDGIPVVVLSFYCAYKSGGVKLDGDSVQYAWVTYEEAKSYDLIDGILEEIKMVDEIISGKTESEVEFNI